MSTNGRVSVWKCLCICAVVALVTGALSAPCSAEDGGEDLAKQAQNPIANLISLPLQNNTSFNIGPYDRTSNVLKKLLAGQNVGTVFVPAKRKLSSRRRWIGQTARTTGQIIVDAGAATALIKRGKSLLPSGIRLVRGHFEKGATVAVLDEKGAEIARGLTNYSAEQLQKIRGLKTAQIAKKLGDKPYDEVIHRNNMTLSS